MGPVIIIAASVSIMAVIAAFQARGRSHNREAFLDPLVDSFARDDERRAEVARILAPDTLPADATPAAPWARDPVAFRDALLRRLQPQGAYTIVQFRVLPADDLRRATATRTEAVILDPARTLGFHVYNDWQEAEGHLYLTKTDVRGTVSADVLTKKEVEWGDSRGIAAAAFDETRPVSTDGAGATLIRTCARQRLR